MSYHIVFATIAVCASLHLVKLYSFRWQSTRHDMARFAVPLANGHVLLGRVGRHLQPSSLVEHVRSSQNVFGCSNREETELADPFRNDIGVAMVLEPVIGHFELLSIPVKRTFNVTTETL